MIFVKGSNFFRIFHFELSPLADFSVFFTSILQLGVQLWRNYGLMTKRRYKHFSFYFYIIFLFSAFLYKNRGCSCQIDTQMTA